MSISSGFSVPILTENYQKSVMKAPLYFAETTKENLIEKHRKVLDEIDLNSQNNKANRAFKEKHPMLHKALQAIKSFFDDDDNDSGGGGGGKLDKRFLPLFGIPSTSQPELVPAYAPAKK